jgi:hypothetical protein
MVVINRKIKSARYWLNIALNLLVSQKIKLSLLLLDLRRGVGVS